MSSSVKDLWPDDFGAGDLMTPVTILKQQATLLGPKTNNLVEAEVVSSSDNTRFVHNLNLIAPALDNYRYKLLTISHTIELYPVNVAYHPRNSGTLATTQDDLIKVLQDKLADEKTRVLIGALIAQSRK